MTLDELKTLQATGQYHHATYRNQNTLWEGLHIYVRDAEGFRGFRHAGVFGKDDPNLQAAEEAVRLTGVSVGAYG
jgi:hypothetical protein